MERDGRLRSVEKYIIVPAMTNALSIDVEEYFQIHVLSGIIRQDTWQEIPSSVRKTHPELTLEGLDQGHLFLSRLILNTTEMGGSEQDTRLPATVYLVIYQRAEVPMTQSGQTGPRGRNGRPRRRLPGTHLPITEDLWPLKILEGRIPL